MRPASRSAAPLRRCKAASASPNRPRPKRLMQASMPLRTSPCPEQPGAADHVAARARPEITAIERLRAVGHEQQELGNTEPLSPAPPRQLATPGTGSSKPRYRFLAEVNRNVARCVWTEWVRKTLTL